jgi:SOS response associated peptidase (SRAP)
MLRFAIIAAASTLVASSPALGKGGYIRRSEPIPLELTTGSLPCCAKQHDAARASSRPGASLSWRGELVLDVEQVVDLVTGIKRRSAGCKHVGFRRKRCSAASPASLFSGQRASLQHVWADWIRTFAIITTNANELVAEIHDRMPLIIAPADYERWLSDEPDPHDLMRPYPAEPMRMLPISTRVNKPENDDSSILEPIKLSAA